MAAFLLASFRRWNDVVCQLGSQLAKIGNPKVNSKPYQISEMELFTTEVNGIQPLAMFAKSSILDIWQASEYAL